LRYSKVRTFIRYGARGYPYLYRLARKCGQALKSRVGILSQVLEIITGAQAV